MTVRAASYRSASATPASSCRPLVLVGPVERLDEHLDGLADLIAKLVGDFLLVRGALGEHRFQRLVVGHAEEPVDAQQGAERPERDRLLEPERRVPRGEPGRLALRGIDQHPVLAVGDEPQPDAGGVEQFHHPGRRRRLPVPPVRAASRGPASAGRSGSSSRAFPASGTPSGFRDHDIGPQGLAVLGDRRLERLGDVLPLDEHLIRQAERLLQHEVDPLPVDRRVRPVALLVVLPLLERQLAAAGRDPGRGRRAPAGTPAPAPGPRGTARRPRSARAIRCGGGRRACNWSTKLSPSVESRLIQDISNADMSRRLPSLPAKCMRLDHIVRTASRSISGMSASFDRSIGSSQGSSRSAGSILCEMVGT